MVCTSAVVVFTAYGMLEDTVPLSASVQTNFKSESSIVFRIRKYFFQIRIRGSVIQNGGSNYGNYESPDTDSGSLRLIN